MKNLQLALKQDSLPAWLNEMDGPFTKNGHQYWKGKLYFNGDLKSFVIPNDGFKQSLLHHLNNAPIVIHIIYDKEHLLSNLAQIAISHMEIIHTGVPFYVSKHLYQYGSLPQQQTGHVTLLIQLIQQLSYSLRQFMIKLFADASISKAFVTYPASHNHHHADKGGLLLHSLECAVMAAQLSKTWMQPLEAEITIVAALLHDIGKIRTYCDTQSSSDIRHFVTHDAMTLEVLAPYLTILDKKWTHAANLLRHMLSWDKKKQLFPSFPGTLLVKLCDQYSTSLDLRQQCFNDKPAWQQYARFDGPGRQKFIRIPI